MTHRLTDKVLLIVLITAAIVLTSESVTAVHVSIVLGSIIILSIDELAKNRYISIALGVVTLIASVLIPLAVFAIPSAIYIMIRRFSMYHIITSAIAALGSVFLAPTGSIGTICFVLGILAAYISNSTEHYEEVINKSTSMFDEARQEARDNARKRREMREKADAEVYTARLKEHNRIAREIHDNVGHMITRVIVQMQAIKIINKDPVVGQQLESVSETLDLAMTGIRRSVHELHDDSIDLAIGINDIAKTLPDTFKCDISTSIESPASNDTKTAILGIVKEAVTNISKHSNGDKVKIDVVENVSFWRVLVHDNGRCPEKEYTDNESMTSDGHGIGLSNIFDRAHGVGGRAIIRSSSSGFEVLVTIPKKEH